MDSSAASQDVKSRFVQKINANYGEYLAAWRKLQPEELIRDAKEIGAISELAEELPELASEEDMEYLLRFKNPLEVASMAWCNSVSYSISDDELDHVLWELRDRGDAEYDYEMEPEFYDGDTPELSM